MATIDRNRIESLVEELDEAIPREGHVEVLQDFHEYHVLHTADEYKCGTIRANQLGYLRLGIEFLKAAHAPTYEDQRVNIDLGYLTACEHHWYSFERREGVRPLYPQERPRSHSPFVEGAIVALFLVVPILVGSFIIIRWLSRALF